MVPPVEKWPLFLKEGQKSRRATFNLTKSFGGLDNIKKGSAVPRITEVCKISRKQNVSAIDLLELFNRNWQGEEKNGDGITQKTRTNSFYYDITFFNDCIIRTMAQVISL